MPGVNGKPFSEIKAIPPATDKVDIMQTFRTFFVEGGNDIGIFTPATGNESNVSVVKPEDIQTIFETCDKAGNPKRTPIFALQKYREMKGHSKGLVLLQEAEWKDLRDKLRDVFVKGDGVGVVAQSHAAKLEEITQELIQTLPTLNASTYFDEFYKWSAESMVQLLLNKRLNSVGKPTTTGSQVQVLVDCTKTFYRVAGHLQINGTPDKWRNDVLEGEEWKSLEACLDQFHTVVAEMVKEASTKETVSPLIHHLEKEKKLAVDVITIVIEDALLGSIENVASFLVCLLHCFGRNPEVQTKALGNDDLTMMDRCMQETQRMYPPAPGLSRIVPNEVVLAGFKIPANQQCAMMLQLSSQNVECFKTPEEFQPERWIKINEEKDAKANWCSRPFGFGKRNCLGESIALHTVKNAAKKIIEKCVVGYPAEPLQIREGLNLIPKGDLKFTFAAREPAN